MLRLTALVGHSNDAELAERLHDLEHDQRVEYLHVSAQDLARKRLRLTTDRGTECAIALPRDVSLQHGSVLYLDELLAVVVRLEELPWLVLEPRDKDSALKLGFLAGHLHWRARFEGPLLKIALDQPSAAYLKRLEGYLEPQAVRVVGEETLS